MRLNQLIVDNIVMHANEMIRVVKENGLIFVDYQAKNDERYGIGIEIEKDTFLDNMPDEEKIPHHYSDIEEIQGLYVNHKCGISPYTYNFKDSNNNIHYIEAFIVNIRKL